MEKYEIQYAREGASVYEVRTKNISFFFSVFGLLTAMLGSSIFMLSSSVGAAGLLWGIFILLFSCFISFISTITIIECATELGTFSCHELIQRGFGLKGLLIYDIFVFLSEAGSLILLMNLIVELFAFCIEYIFEAQSWISDPDSNWLILILCSVTALPLSFLWSSGTIKLAYTLNWLAISFFCFTIIVEFITSGWNDVALMKFTGTADALSTAVFSYTCETNALEIFSEMYNPTKSRMRKATIVSFLSMLGICLFIGIVGYLTFGEEKLPILMDTASCILPIAYLLLHPTQRFPIISLILLIISLSIAQQFNIRPAKDALRSLIGYSDLTETRLVRTLLLLITTYFSILLTMIIPNPIFMLNLVGSLCSPVVSFIFPSLIYLWLIDQPKYVYIHYFNIAFGFVLTVLGTIYTFMS